MVQYDPRKTCNIHPPSAIGARAGRNTSFFFLFIYFFIVDITQSHLYTYYIMTSKKRVISLIKIFMYIIRVHRICTIRIYTLGYMSLIIHINYYNILIITGTFCP